MRNWRRHVRLFSWGLLTATLLSCAAPRLAASQDQDTAPGGAEDVGVAPGMVALDGLSARVNQTAAEIAAAGEAALQKIAERRRRLPYGLIEPESPPPPGASELTVYPAPEGIEPSDQYAVTVEQRGVVLESFVYKTLARKPDTNRSEDTSWTSFSFAGEVTVAVRKLHGTATGCLVRPASLGLATRFEGNTCYITLNRPANFSVEFHPNVQSPIAHPMLVFANPPEVNVPAPGDPNVLYFGPGIHRIGERVPVRSGQTIYIAGGAWVEGTFAGNGVRDVVIKGRGVISGLFIDTGNQDLNKDQPGLIDLLNADNVLVEGITFVDAPRFNVRVLGQYVTLRNLKTISWWYSTDGVWGGRYSLIEDNFIKVNDDAIKLNWGDNVARRNVVWQLENGGPFHISWNLSRTTANHHAYDNDVIHAEHYFLQPQGIFHARHAGSGHPQRYLFEDIRIEDANWRLFYIVIENNKWYDPSAGYGRISSLIFRNIQSDSTFLHPSVIKGMSPEHSISDATFQDIRAGGQCLDASAFSVDPATTYNVRVVRTPACGAQGITYDMLGDGIASFSVESGPYRYVEWFATAGDRVRPVRDFLGVEMPTRELYNIEADPDARVNLAQEPAYQELVKRLAAEVRRTLGDRYSDVWITSPAPGAILNGPTAVGLRSPAGTAFSAYRVKVDGRTVYEGAAPPTGPILNPAALQPGSHVLSIEAIDADGRTHRDESMISVEHVRLTAPEIGARLTGPTAVRAELRLDPQDVSSAEIALRRADGDDAAAGQPAEHVAYRGASLPETISVDTLAVPDGPYDLVVRLETRLGVQSETRIRVFVYNWETLQDDVQAPQEAGWYGVVERMRTVERSDGWEFTGSASDTLFGDGTRIRRQSEKDTFLVWRMPGLRTFAFTLYIPVVTPDRRPEDADKEVYEEAKARLRGLVSIHVSADGEAWEPVPYSVAIAGTCADRSGTVWCRAQVTGTVEPGQGGEWIRLMHSGPFVPEDEPELGFVALQSLRVQKGDQR